MKNLKVLVTGAGGFIGSHVCESLLKMGNTVKALVHYNSRNSWGWLEQSYYLKEIQIVTGDIRDFDTVREVSQKQDVIIHLAALIGIPYSYRTQDAYVATNINGTLNILKAAREYDVKRVIHISTSEVYGTAQYVPIDERHPINPQSPYAATKASADFLALAFQKSFGTPVSIVRPFNNYGPRQSARAVVPTIITQILQGKRMIKLGSVDTTRDMVYVKDTVNGIIKVIESENTIGEIVHIGTNRDISIYELAMLIASLMKCMIQIEYDPERARPEKSEVKKLIADITKIKNIVGWEPSMTLEEGLLETINWFQDNKSVFKTDIYNI